jgi:hypothetical protein
MGIGNMDRPLFITVLAIAIALGIGGCTAQVVTPEESAAILAQESTAAGDTKAPGGKISESGTGPVTWVEPLAPTTTTGSKAGIDKITLQGGATGATGQAENVR